MPSTVGTLAAEIALYRQIAAAAGMCDDMLFSFNRIVAAIEYQRIRNFFLGAALLSDEDESPPSFFR
jgi:hypothetical protein